MTEKTPENNKPPGKITKTYARTVIFGVIVVVAALLIAAWGLIGLYFEISPVMSENIPTFAAPISLLVALIFLAWVMWQQTFHLLRGGKPVWSLTIVVAGVAYLIWCLGGVLAGMTVQETWLSPFAFTLLLFWPFGLLMFWFLMTRKLYTGKGTPKWPWEDRDEEERRRP